MRKAKSRLTISILLNAAIAAEEAHSAHTGDTLLHPTILVLERLIDKRVRFHVAVEIIRDKIIIALVDDAVAQRCKSARVTEHAALDGVKDFGEVGIEGEAAVVVSVAEILDVLGEVAEEEDVPFADLTGDFNVGAVAGADDEAAIEDKFHIGGS